MQTDATTTNVTLVRDLYTAFGQADIAAVLSVLSPEVEWGEPDNPINPAAGTRHGHAGFLEWVRIGKESEEILELEPSRFVAQDDVVAVLGHTTCRARSTGRTYETDFVHVITLVDGKVTRFRELFDTYAAAEAYRP